MPACAKFSGVATRKSRKKKEDESGVEKGRLRVHDAFELIRWLALSQPDPRKALAELVQNSLDAGARHVHITRVREKKMTCLKILDDGEGVIPELTRAEALRYIATNIGHSRKRDLSPKQRLELMTQGQYGIRLLGFWSLGDMLEIRSHLPDQKPYRLILHRDRSDFQIEPLRGKLDFHERRTEVVVVNLTKEASAAVAARRASDYLAGELRGQLLGRDVELVVNDKMARGRSPKSLRVRPPRFLGERLDGLGPVDVVGHAGQAPVRLEIHLTGEDADEASPPLALYASGTMVAESFTELAALGLDHPPWTDSRLTGLVDFSGLRVTPGSRRGVIPDDVAYAFAASLTKVEPVLSNLIETKDRERREELDKNVIRDLKRAFRDFYKKRPRYTMLPTEDKGAGAEEAGPGSLVDQETATGPLEDTETGASTAALFPPGPLASAAITPKRVIVDLDGETQARARALDADGRVITDGVTFSWELWGHVGYLREHAELAEPAELASVVTFIAGERVAEGILSVTVKEKDSDREASAAAPVEVVETLPTGSDEGIPEPELVDHAGAKWRSRFHQGRWQVNIGHADYKANSARPALKLRYLAMLFAKEIVLRSSQDPRLDEPLEQIVEVAAYADRQLTEKPPRGRRRRKKDLTRRPCIAIIST